MPAASLVAGLVLLPVASFAAQGLMALHRQVIAVLLCDSETRALEQRVETLEESRKAVLDVEASELRRIERDLHDGAQQRLVMLTINLGLAAERIDSDPEAAKGLVIEARDQARLALAEIRDLVRGIAPSILMDRGLVPALGGARRAVAGADDRADRRCPRASGCPTPWSGPRTSSWPRRSRTSPSTPARTGARSTCGARDRSS